MRILGIETSADETGVAILEASGTDERDFSYKVLGSALLSQAELHTRYGGIFPNLAKREHGRNLVPVLMEALRLSGEIVQGRHDVSEDMIKSLEPLLAREKELYTYLSEFFRAYDKPKIDAIAVTMGPGLEPALWVGINFAKALAQAWSLPLVAVNHLEGHIMIARAKDGTLIPIKEPAVALLVSGGHTELILTKAWQSYSTIGATRDDAAGEAFDKTARLIGLPYPGGPQISKLALEARDKNIPRTIELPRPMIKEPNYDFSFSGLKTAVKKIVDGWHAPTHDMKADLAREVEDAIVDVLLTKTKRAVEEHGAETVVVGGGVSANDHLRSVFEKEFDSKAQVLFPTREFSTDNAVMIALAGYFSAQKGTYISADDLRANGNLRLAN